MALTQITAVNQTAGDINLTRMGLTVPASGSIVLTDFAYIHEIKSDESLHSAIVAGNVALEVGDHVLTLEQSLSWFINVSSEVKYPVSALADANVASLSGTTTIDGVSLVAGDRVVLTAQTTASENGIWVINSGAWTRPNDFPAGGSAAGALVQVTEGTTYGNQLWSCTSDKASSEIDTDNLAFEQVSGSDPTLQEAYVAGNSITTSGAEGSVVVGGTETLQVTATGGLDVDTVFDFDGTSFDVQMTGDNGFSIDGTAASNITVATDADAEDLTISVTGATDSSVIVSSSGTGTDAISLDASAGGIALSSNGLTTIDGSGIDINGSGAAINIGNDADAQPINIGTGAAARTIILGNQTSGTSVEIDAADNITLDSDVVVTGNLDVQGNVTSINTEQVNVEDNFFYMSQNYTSAAAKTGGLVVNYLPTATTDTVDTGGFTAGVSSTSDATVATTGAATFSAGDIIQISGAANAANDGLYEVVSHAANVLTIRGQLTSTVEAFSQTNFTADTTAQGDITKVTVSVIRAGTDGVWETGSGSTTGITYSDLATSAGSTLNQAYVAGNTITTSGAEGSVIIAGTETLQVTATGGLDVDTALDFDGSSFDIQMTGTNGFSIDGTAASNVTVDSGDLTLSTTTSGDVVISGADSSQLQGYRYYGASATGPTTPTPADGDRYYDTALDMEMRYDGTRSKWLSVEAFYIQFGRNGSTNVGQYYRGIDGIVMSDTTGYRMPYAGTIVGLGYTRSDTDATDFEVTEGGSLSVAVASSAVSGADNTLNTDVSSGGILGIRNEAAGNVADDVLGWVKVRFRGA